MRRLAFWLAVGLLTFIVGVAATWVRIFRTPLHSTVQSVREPQVRPLEVPINLTLTKISGVPEPIKEWGTAKIQFVDPSYGWLQIDGDLWRTSDGGESWQFVNFPKSPQVKDHDPSLKKFQLITPRIAWVISDSKLYRTEDGGISWKFISQPIAPFMTNGWPRGLFNLFFRKDGRRGWIEGERWEPLTAEDRRYYPDPHSEYSPDGTQVVTGVTYYTEDGGRSWERASLQFDGIFEFDEEHAWSYGLEGVFSMRGKRWAPAKDTLADGSTPGCLATGCGSGCTVPTSIFFLNHKLGWVSNSDGYLGKSVDGGRTWTDVSHSFWAGLGSNYYNVEVYFVDERVGWGLNTSGDLLSSRNGGATWRMEQSGFEFYDMYFLNPEQGWLVSNKGIFRLPGEYKCAL